MKVNFLSQVRKQNAKKYPFEDARRYITAQGNAQPNLPELEVCVIIVVGTNTNAREGTFMFF
jgi:hypothetical protein